MVLRTPTRVPAAPANEHRGSLLRGIGGGWRRNGADAIFIGLLSVIALLRWQVIDSVGEPSGLDPGNWLAFGHSLMGSQSRSASLAYPPLVPLLSVAFSAVWGPLRGSAVLGLLCSLAPAVGTYVFLRAQLGIRAVFLAGLLGAAATTTEAEAWGGYPQLLGLGLLPLLIWAIERFLRTRRMESAYLISLLLFLLFATNDLIGAIGIGVATTYSALRLILVNGERPRSGVIRNAVLVAFVPSLSLLPTYLRLAGGFFSNDTVRLTSQHIGATNLFSDLNNVFKDNPALWYLTLVLAFAAPIILLVRHEHLLAMATTAVLIPTLAVLNAIGQYRVVFVLPLAMAFGVGAWWTLLKGITGPTAAILDKVLIATFAIVLLVQFALSTTTFESQVKWYAALNPGIVAGLQELDKIAPRNSVLSVGPAPNLSNQEGWPLGWWVEGILDRPTFYASDLQWLYLPDERRRANLANQMFSRDEGFGSAIPLARSNGITYIVVAKAWAGYQVWISNKGSPQGVQVVIDNDSLLVLSISPLDSAWQPRSASRERLG